MMELLFGIPQKTIPHLLFQPKSAFISRYEVVSIPDAGKISSIMLISSESCKLTFLDTYLPQSIGPEQISKRIDYQPMLVSY